ncbi:MAG: hypothetical protein HY921_02150 [Elusimicrobia bacterium]|nr:hypothetical protein [Elusimicrobiota bacterium]
MIPKQKEVLNTLLRELKSKRPGASSPLVVFDLDDTLLSTAQRHIRILREFCAQIHIRLNFFEEAWTLCQLDSGHLHYSILDTAVSVGVKEPEILAELKSFWQSRFFTNEYLRTDLAVPGAAVYCREVLKSGGRLVYLTGRDETMRTGTLESLKSNNFPMPEHGGEVELILKPRFEVSDWEFKNEAVQRLQKKGVVAAGFENEPAHINLFHETFPKAKIVFVDTKHSPRPIRPYAQIPWIRDFLR